MSIQNGDNASPHELELIVRTELTQLTLTGTSQPDVAVEGVPAVEPVPDTDALRYEIRLRALLDAVVALQDGDRPGDQ